MKITTEKRVFLKRFCRKPDILLKGWLTPEIPTALTTHPQAGGFPGWK